MDIVFGEVVFVNGVCVYGFVGDVVFVSVL